MLKNIKCSFFFKFLFSHTSEGKKLKVARYSKYLQEILDRRLIHYKIFSQRYMILDKDGKGKEYDNYDELIYEGEYLNGKRHGIGKEYDYDGNLIFEGNYLNGKRNGKGKEYNKKGKLKFEGNYINGKRNGKGKEYNVDTGKLKFEGEYYEDLIISFISNNQKDNLAKFNKKEDKYLNESINGKIKLYDIDTGKLKFEGEYLNGKKWEGKIYYSFNNEVSEIKNGKGKIKIYGYKNTLIFEGEYLNGEANGKGKEYYDNGKLFFEGEYLNGEANGKGKEYNEDGELLFEGEYSNGIRWNGKGKEYNEDEVSFYLI